MKSLTGLSCPNKWCSRKAGSPELVASGIWCAELTQSKGNKSFHVASEQRHCWSVVLPEANLQPVRLGRVLVSQDIWLFLGSLKHRYCCHFLAQLQILRLLPGTEQIHALVPESSLQPTPRQASMFVDMFKKKTKQNQKATHPYCHWT